MGNVLEVQNARVCIQARFFTFVIELRLSFQCLGTVFYPFYFA